MSRLLLRLPSLLLVATIASATLPVLADTALPAVQATLEAQPSSQELEELAARDAADPSLESFEGGEPVFIIGGSLLTLALLIVIIVLLID